MIDLSNIDSWDDNECTKDYCIKESGCKNDVMIIMIL